MRGLIRFFSSLRVAFLLLVSLGVLSILGTIIPQKREIPEYFGLFPRFAGAIHSFGLDDLFHGPVFIALLSLLCLSTLVCTSLRIRLLTRRWSARLETASPHEVLSYPTRVVLGSAISLPHGNGWRSLEANPGYSLALRTSGKSSLLGGVLIHLGILVFFLGGLWGFHSGVEFTIHGKRGEKIRIPSFLGARALWEREELSRQMRGLMHVVGPKGQGLPAIVELDNRIASWDAVYRKEQATPLFRLEFTRLWVEHGLLAPPADNPDGMVSTTTVNWNSEVLVHDPGVASTQGVIRVNSPFSYGGYMFYQSDWDQQFDSVNLEITALEGPASGTVLSLVATMGMRLKFDICSFTFVMRSFFPDFGMDHGEYFSRSNQLNCPVALLDVLDEAGKPQGHAWAFPPRLSGMGGMHDSGLPIRFTVVGADPTIETVIQVAYDPGTPLVWLGSVFLVAGMFLSFFVRYLEHWVVRSPDGVVTLVVNGNRAPFLLEGDLDGLRAELAEEGSYAGREAAVSRRHPGCKPPLPASSGSDSPER